MKKIFVILFAPFFISFCLASLIKVKSPDKYALNLSDIDLNQYLIIDARSKEEFEVSHITKALHANELDVVKKHIQKHPRLKPLVLIYCNEKCSYSKHFSKLIRDELKQENIYYLKGGFQSWSQTLPTKDLP